MLVLKDRQNQPVQGVDNWTRPKKPELQWKDGRSAKELAKAWFATPVCPPAVSDLLASRPETAGITLTEGWPEYTTPLPERGEGRNHDLLLLGRRHNEQVVVAIEAKVDEPFGPNIGEYWTAAQQSGKPTRVPQRIEALLGMVFGPNARPDQAPWKDLRYQLLTMVAGTALEADRQKASTAVAIIHEFHTELASPDRLAANGADLNAFMSVLLSQPGFRVVPGQLYGPVRLHVGRSEGQAVSLFIGKAIS
jgi:hypothetical protein